MTGIAAKETLWVREKEFLRRVFLSGRGTGIAGRKCDQVLVRPSLENEGRGYRELI